MNAHLPLIDDGEIVEELIARPDLLNRVLQAQKNDEKIYVIVSQIGEGKGTKFSMKEDGSLYYKDLVCVTKHSELKNPF